MNTYTHPFQDFINSYKTISASEWNIIAPCIEYIAIGPETPFLKIGDHCQNLYFLESGTVKVSYCDQDKLKTKHFIEGSFAFTSLISFIENKPSDEQYETTGQCKLWKIDRKKVFQLMKLDIWNSFFCMLLKDIHAYYSEVLQPIGSLSRNDQESQMTEKLLRDTPLSYQKSYFQLMTHHAIKKLLKNNSLDTSIEI